MSWGEDEAQRRIARAAQRGEKSLWLKDLGLTELPEEILQIKDLRALHLQGNHLERLPSWLLTGQPLLEVLNLSGNSLAELPDWIGRFRELRQLRLYGNDVSALPESMTRLTKLVVLDIGMTDLPEIPPWLTRLTELRWLGISDLLITELPPRLAELRHLATLDASENRLADLPTWLADLQRLDHLYLSGNRFEQLPEVIGRMPQLVVLDVHNCKLHDLPTWLPQLTELRYLRASSNLIIDLDDSIGELANLRRLRIDENELRGLPDSLRHLTKLTELSVANNDRFHDAPSWIGELSRLKRLYLGLCGLMAVPGWVRGLRRLVELNLNENLCPEIPEWIGELSSLRVLSLANNSIVELPAELADLDHLHTLTIYGNPLNSLPGRLGGMRNLSRLDVQLCGLSELPVELSALSKLTVLDLQLNQFSELPDWIGRLPRLQSLYLGGNQLTELPSTLSGHTALRHLTVYTNPISELPDWIGELGQLTELGLGSDSLLSLPNWLGSLTRLRDLYIYCAGASESWSWLENLRHLRNLHLSNGFLAELPAPIARLRRLRWLTLNENELTRLPDWINELPWLLLLNANDNQLEQLPSSLSGLRRLRFLYVSHNKIPELSATLGELDALESLYMSANGIAWVDPLLSLPSQLTQIFLEQNAILAVPESVSTLRHLRLFRIDNNEIRVLPEWLLDLPRVLDPQVGNNPLVSPPPEIAANGNRAILQFHRECKAGSAEQWVSKLLVVGEGGVGKTSLIKKLVDEPFDPAEATTHGMRIFDYQVPHPHRRDVEMLLRTWDFGGQEIYHATHQFFLTDRSLFLLLWNSRSGWEQGKLRYWLDIIGARAPKSPVVLVATHSAANERPVDLPLDDLRREYPQIVDSVAIDNETEEGLGAVRELIAERASKLPLMGEQWPASWLQATRAVDALPDQHVPPARLWQEMTDAGLADSQYQRYVAGALHTLGSILFHMDDPQLSETVILRPEWVNAYISRVLDSNEVERRHGLLSRQLLNELWADLDHGMRDHFLRMMDEYDLSYRTESEGGGDVSLVVERLPWNAPAGYEERWNLMPPGTVQEHEIRMIYQLNTTPPGIPTWFIARSHRFTTDTHWRSGALLAHPDRRHRALIRTDRHRNELELAVRGPSPATFFAVLNDGLNFTLGRYPGLSIKRMVPCNCSTGCTELYEYEDLQRRLERTPPRTEIECRKSGDDVYVPRLLLGIPPSDRDDIRRALDRVVKSQTDLGERFSEQASDLQRMFLRLQQQIQSGLDTRCPSVFAITQTRQSRLRGTAYEIALYCEEPGSWHPLPDDAGVYQISQSPAWLRTMGPYLRELVVILKHAAPLAGPVLGATVEHLTERLKSDVELMAQLVDQIPDVDLHGENPVPDPRQPDGPSARATNEAGFRVLERWLAEIDPAKTWGGLSRVTTPEGLTLYLCPDHAAPYSRGR
ncbi:MAG TPA: COR domain-containing protein [Actinospica sp.]|jgi:Leucine-rich repeat (LRR) protein|nr:COR domain-containing protein [Actinospica sp.]